MTEISKEISILEMAPSDRFCLRWKDFEENLTLSLAGIRDKSKFLDCTLVTDDDEAHQDSLRAHRVVLSASSNFFQAILERDSLATHPNPLIYLKGVSAKNMGYMLDFMYRGEVYVAHGELDKFLEVAETLKIKGLSQGPNVSRAKRRSDPLGVSNPPSNEDPCNAPLSEAELEAEVPEDHTQVTMTSNESAHDGMEVFEERQGGDNDMDQQGEKGECEKEGAAPKEENDLDDIEHKRPFTKICSKPSLFQCSFCSYKTGELSNIKRHFDGIHSKEAKHYCQFCDRKFKTAEYRRKHEKVHMSKAIKSDPMTLPAIHHVEQSNMVPLDNPDRESEMPSVQGQHFSFEGQPEFLFLPERAHVDLSDMVDERADSTSGSSPAVPASAPRIMWSAEQTEMVSILYRVRWLYRVTKRVRTWVGLTYIWDVPTSCLNRR